MTFKITARQFATDLDGDILTAEDKMAEAFIVEGMRHKSTGSVTIEYIGDVAAEMTDEMLEPYLAMVAQKYGRTPDSTPKKNSNLRERG